MKIQVLGSGCPTCHKLYEMTVQAAKELNLRDEVEYITDVEKIIEMGVMQSPVLAIDGKAIIAGSVPRIDAIKEALAQTGCGGCSDCQGTCDCGGKCC